MEEKIYEYTTFPREFVTYKWFKPLIVAAVFAVFAILAQAITAVIGAIWMGGMDEAVQAASRSSEHFFSGPGALMAIASVAGLLPALAIAVRIVRDRPFSSYSSSRGGWNWSAFFKCLVLAVIVIGGLLIIQQIVYPDVEADHVNKFTIIGIIICLVFVPLQATAEEYLYRGLLMQAIGSWTKLPALAVVLSSLIFAVSHNYSTLGIFAVFFDGMMFAIVAWYSKGLEASSAAHIVNNLFVFFSTGLGFASSQEGGIEALTLVIIINVVYVAAIILLDKKFNWFTSKGDGAAEFNERHRIQEA